MRQQPAPHAEPPRPEPEIIPPGADFPPGSSFGRVSYQTHGNRIHTVKLGPVGLVMALLAAGLVAVAGFVMLLGALLVGAAIAGVVVVGTVISRLLGGPSRR